MSEFQVTNPGTHLVPSQFIEGCAFLIDKPSDWTSFDVVNKVRGALRRATGVKKIKVGHSGTLDPMATGLLITCTGKWTKKLDSLQGLDKIYTGELKLGGITASYDRETEVIDSKPYEHVTLEMITTAASKLTGMISQYPPMFSAIKVGGTPLYKLARKGRTVDVDPREVKVHRFEILSFNPPFVQFEVHCSKGTYIRTLAHDIGQILDCGAHLTALRRTRIGDYSLQNAWDLDSLVSAIEESGEGD